MPRRVGVPARLQPRELFIGPSQRAICIEPGHQVDVIGVRFRPGGARLLLDAPLAEYRETVLSPDTAGIRPGFDAIDALTLHSLSERVDLLQRFLLRHASGAHIDRAVSYAELRIASTSGAIRIEALAEELGMTMRHLQRRFQTAIGLTPKTLARIARVRYALSLARERKITLARIAATAGYADQSHFNRQFRDIAGVTPSEFFHEQNALDDFFALH